MISGSFFYDDHLINLTIIFSYYEVYFSYDIVVVVVSSPHQSPRCGVLRVEKVWKFLLPTMSAGNPAAMWQLQFGSL